MDWPSIIDEHGPAVLRISARILGTGTDAEDVVQETFFDAYRHWQRGSVANWGGLLRKIATRRAIDALRRRRVRTPLSHDPELPKQSPDEQLSIDEMKQLVRQELALLPNRQAEVFAMRYLDDLSNSEIAQALGMSVSSVSTALSKARMALARKLAHLKCGDPR